MLFCRYTDRRPMWYDEHTLSHEDELQGKGNSISNRHGMSTFCHTTIRELADALEILDYETARSEMVENHKRWIQPNAAAQIVALAERMAESYQKVSLMNIRANIGTEAV